ncbi:MAG: TRAP-type C4-dicarboxylate transport system permease small subunit [Paracoccaceae bacterium]|jgi:TRAP-type C4-dicarboxylate transport system permease small subunit
MAEMMPVDDASLPLGGGRGPLASKVSALIEAWALLGGVSLLAVILINTISVTGAYTLNMPFPGDFELTEMGICIAAFAFLPYCQLAGANVTADIFTEGASPRWQAGFAFAASVVAFLFAMLLLSRMWAGMLSKMEYVDTTTILQLPHWMAYVPILVSLGLLAIAAVMTLGDNWRAMRAR